MYIVQLIIPVETNCQPYWLHYVVCLQKHTLKTSTVSSLVTVKNGY